MKRDKIDFTDNELRIICSAIDKYVYSRDSFFTQSSANITNSVIKKLIDNGMKRKNPEKIIYPIYNFEEEK